MDIKNLADLAKIAALCRKKGIETIKIGPDCIEFTLSAATPTERRSRQSAASDQASEEQAGPTEEELLFWSSAGISDQAPSEGIN